MFLSLSDAITPDGSFHGWNLAGEWYERAYIMMEQGSNETMRSMRWIKKGLLYTPPGTSAWTRHSCLQPTPFILPDGTIRIFAGFRDREGTGRIGFVDVSGTNPAHVLRVSGIPVLDVGTPGSFDQHGVIPCAVIKQHGKLYLYYAGYTKNPKRGIRFTAFSGLAVSTDLGESFIRYQTGPILPPSPGESLFRAIHTIRYQTGRFRIWYGAGDHFIHGKTKSLPVYNIRYMESPDGIRFPRSGRVVLRTKPGEYRLGRPYVLKFRHGYEMYFGYSTKTVPYRLTYATSPDGIHWKRNDTALNLTYKKGDFDSTMSAYPAVIPVGKKTYLFYNGNDYGKMGIGWARLAQ